MSTLIELLSVVTVLALVTPGLVEFDKRVVGCSQIKEND